MERHVVEVDGFVLDCRSCFALALDFVVSAHRWRLDSPSHSLRSLLRLLRLRRLGVRWKFRLDGDKLERLSRRFFFFLRNFRLFLLLLRKFLPPLPPRRFIRLGRVHSRRESQDLRALRLWYSVEFLQNLNNEKLRLQRIWDGRPKNNDNLVSRFTEKS